MKLLPLLLIMLISISCDTSREKESPSEVMGLSQQELSEARFDENRIFVDLKSKKGEIVSFYTDTGGGKVIYPEAAEKLGLKIDSVREGENVMEMLSLVKLFEEQLLPAPIGPHFVYRQEHGEREFDGMLGAHWFANKIWNFDYKGKKLYSVETVDWDLLNKDHVIELGFMENEQGEHLTHFPRVPIIVEGDTIQTLFDSGANAPLSAAAQSKFGGARHTATSFIVASVFDKWKTEHPEWDFIEGADKTLDEDMILVPTLEIAGHVVGPVWFTRRKDSNFTEFMSQWMDETVYGAIGGSCFQYFSSLIIDYPSEQAYFGR